MDAILEKKPFGDRVDFPSIRGTDNYSVSKQLRLTVSPVAKGLERRAYMVLLEWRRQLNWTPPAPRCLGLLASRHAPDAPDLHDGRSATVNPAPKAIRIVMPPRSIQRRLARPQIQLRKQAIAALAESSAHTTGQILVRRLSVPPQTRRGLASPASSAHHLNRNNENRRVCELAHYSFGTQ